jgi:hypothetical protein
MNKKEFVKRYYCSKHGNNGNANCKECKNKLKKLCKDNNALLIGEIN